jgi:anti-sigma regulatory factor (Ser/Thr protein kinase)
LPSPGPVGYSHRAVLYESSGDLAASVLPFLRQGLEAGEAVAAFVQEENVGALREGLSPAERKVVAVVSSDESYRHPARALAGLHGLLHDHVEEGRGARVVGEQPLAHLPEEKVAELCRVDAAFDAVCAFPGVQVVCPYNARTLPPSLIERVQRSHGTLMADGGWVGNPAYEPPEALLCEDRARTVLSEPPPWAAELRAPESPSQARRFVADHLATVGADGGADVEDLLLAVGEVVANAFEHATAERVRAWRTGSRMVCEVHDRGPGIADVLAGYRQPEITWVKGRGLWLAHQLTDRVEIQTASDGTTVRLHKDITEPTKA